MLVVDASGSTCSKGMLTKVTTVAVDSDHYSWSIIRGKGIVEVEVYNPNPHNNLGFFQLDIYKQNGKKVEFNPNFYYSVSALQTKKIRFNVPKTVTEERGIKGRLRGTLFKCEVPKTPRFDPNKPFTAPPEDVARARRTQEIYDNCIIDLMPDQPKIQPTKRNAIKSKCERISKNPSFLENLKY